MTESNEKRQKKKEKKEKTLNITVKESHKSRVAQPFTKIIMLIQKYSIIATIPRISAKILFFERGEKKRKTLCNSIKFAMDKSCLNLTINSIDKIHDMI